ncbi:hypothetical protein ACHAWF_012470, partial [Thalassiosira exigua]
APRVGSILQVRSSCPRPARVERKNRTERSTNAPPACSPRRFRKPSTIVISTCTNSSSTMRVNSAAAVLLPAVVSWPSATAVDYLEPHVQRHASVLPPSVCKQLIELGEKAGFLIREESIDEDEQDDPTNKYIPSQTIDVYDNGSDPLEYTGEAEVGDEAIWSVLQPWIPEITQIVKDNRNKEGFAQFYPDDPDREPKLHWIFFRKYSPEDERNSLKHHHDTNMNTVNIELSNDYTGGGLFYIKPRASTGKISKQINDAGYEWIDTIKRENTSEIVFPDLRAGDAIFYNYTVEHGVAPCESGTRYSMAFFYDMDNPAVKVCSPTLICDVYDS